MAAGAPLFFSAEHLAVIGDAGAISEELLTDFFALTESDWRQWPYEVRTLRELDALEHPGDAFAHLVRYGKGWRDKRRGRDCRDFYRICLNDTYILQKTCGGDKNHLLPFMVYVLVHELVHIVRFGRYRYLPLRENGRVMEEARVAELTNEIVGGISLPGLRGVIAFFSGESREPRGAAGEPVPRARVKPYRRCSDANI